MFGTFTKASAAAIALSFAVLPQAVCADPIAILQAKGLRIMLGHPPVDPMISTRGWRPITSAASFPARLQSSSSTSRRCGVVATAFLLR